MGSPLPTAAPIPVTVLGGYLGSGKTTRINEFLRRWQGPPVAVVVNDFGTVNVDAALVRSVSDDVVELENGCICCSFADGMPGVLRALAERAPSRVVMELSGVGLPRPARSWAGYPGFRLDGVVVTVDVTTLEARLADRWVADVVRDQIEQADLLLLTHVDLADASVLRHVRDRVQALAPHARVLTGPLADALQATDEPSATGGLEASTAHVEHHTATVSCAIGVSPERVERWLAARPVEVVRVKGLLATTVGLRLLQVAGNRLVWSEPGPEVGELGCEVVAIATPGIDDAAWQEWLAAAPS